MKIEPNKVGVTVIIPCFNAGKELKETLDSVSRQNGVLVEIIVIDDGSCEDAAHLIRRLCENYSEVRHHRLEKNGGVAAARNVGIELASYDIMAFCDADDMWLRNKLLSQVDYVAAGFLCCTECVYVDENGDEINRSKGYKGEINQDRILKTNDIICSSVVISKEQLGQSRFPDLRKRQDHALWIELIGRGVPVFKIDEYLVRYRVSPKSLSGNKFDAMRWSYFLLREHLALSRMRAAYFFLCYLFIGVQKQWRRRK